MLGYGHGAVLGEQPGCRESWGRAASGPCSLWCGCQRPLCFAGSLAGESCVPECQPTMYLSREPRRCESCPAGTGTSSPPAPARENPKTFGHHGPKPERDWGRNRRAGRLRAALFSLLPSPWITRGRSSAASLAPTRARCRCWDVFPLERLLGSFSIFIRAVLYFLLPSEARCFGLMRLRGRL